MGACGISRGRRYVPWSAVLTEFNWMDSEPTITKTNVRVYTVPTDAPEGDGTFQWNRTTMVLVELWSGASKGIGYTYADGSTAQLTITLLEELVHRRNAFEHAAILQAMYRRVRNLGTTGIAMMAISAIDSALWDLRAQIAELPLVSLLGRLRDGIDVYGSGGFTTYDDKQLRSQFGGWAEQGIRMVKMKIGSHPNDDVRRVTVARKAIGDDVRLF